MSQQRLFIRHDDAIEMLDFNLIPSYSLLVRNGKEILLKVKLDREDNSRTYNVQDISERLGSISLGTNNGIYYEIKNMCIDLVKSYPSVRLPSWMTAVNPH